MKTLLLIDANSLIHRAFHALPPLTSPAGESVGALYGISTMLMRILKEDAPAYVAAAFDRPEPTFRKKIFSDYKAHRPPAADELISQIIRAHDVFHAFHIPTFETPGFEADDIIGTFTHRFSQDPHIRVIILTGDLDTLQFVEGTRIVVRTPKKGASETLDYDATAVEARFGLHPKQMPDYKGLVGDASDNIPGVLGVGPKTAAKLLSEYGTLEHLLESLPSEHTAAKKILPHKEIALFSKQLAIISTEAPVSASLQDLAYTPASTGELETLFTALGFQSLLRRIRPATESSSHAHSSPSTATPPIPDPLILLTADAVLGTQNIATSLAPKVAHGWKEIFKELAKKSVTVHDPLFDLEIAGWLLDADKKDFSLDTLAERFLPGTTFVSAEEKARALYVFFKTQFHSYALDYVFEKIEMPLIRVLASMEMKGIHVDSNSLHSLGESMDTELTALTEQIYKEAGTIFNINSPQQVAHILFDTLALGTGRKKTTSQGHTKTGRAVLESLQGTHPIIDHILAYRETFKIRTSFVSPLLESIGTDQRVHTLYLQTGTTTGRLASEQPNLQNIPQESKWAEPLRNTFHAEPGFHFVSLDYSQLELRLLAHVSQDSNLIEAFRNDEDIHALTASKIFHVPQDRVEKEMRRVAKTLNFGVIYGMGPRAFAASSGHTLEESKKFIREYFESFPRIREWQEHEKVEVKKLGYVKNLNGRRRWFAKTTTPFLMGEMERAAINMPLQSLGADILKLSMIHAFRHAETVGNGKIRLLLSIHDELLFEISDAILKETLPKIRKIMETVISLDVPLKTELKVGTRWGSMTSEEA